MSRYSSLPKRKETSFKSIMSLSSLRNVLVSNNRTVMALSSSLPERSFNRAGRIASVALINPSFSYRVDPVNHLVTSLNMNFPAAYDTLNVKSVTIPTRIPLAAIAARFFADIKRKLFRKPKYSFFPLTKPSVNKLAIALSSVVAQSKTDSELEESNSVSNALSKLP